MSMKTSHSADTKGMTSKARSHIVSRLEKAARTAEGLSDALSSPTSGASPTDLLDARAYAALLRGAALFEKQSWEPCLKSYAICRIIYNALATSAKGDAFKDLLSETIDPSIRYAAYQAKIPRTQPIAAIARKAFDHADPELVDRVKSVNPAVLEHGDPDARKGAEGAPTTLVWRGREVKIEDAAIAIAWDAVGTARGQLAEKLASAGSLHPKDMAGAYDEILNASQDAVDATKQAIDELRAEGVTQGDPRMQSLQITRTAVNYEMISWRIGRNRVLVGGNDGVKLEFGVPSRKKRQAEESTGDRSKDEAPGRQIARLKEKVVLYDGILQSLESIKELPGVANDQEFSGRLEATSQYFTALKYVSPVTLPLHPSVSQELTG
jgi:signal recognition particle subunit SRP68